MDIDYHFVDKVFVERNLGRLCSMVKGLKCCSWQEENFLKDLPSKWFYSMAAELKGEIVGFSINSAKDNNIVYTHLIVVDSNYRGECLGSSLMSALISRARKHGMKELRLRCPAENTSAARFYNKMGFKKTDTIYDETSHPYTGYLFSMKI